jgi:hypothetical protein
VSALLATTSLPALAADVTTQRLMNSDKEPQNWLMVNKDYSSHRYSELGQSAGRVIAGPVRAGQEDPLMIRGFLVS